MNYITRLNILLRLTSPDTIFVLYADFVAYVLLHRFRCAFRCRACCLRGALSFRSPLVLPQGALPRGVLPKDVFSLRFPLRSS